IVAPGSPLKPGDNVLISDFEHENNTFPWRHLNAQGIEVRWAKPEADGRVTIDCYYKLLDDRTRILSASWVTYGNGYRADVPALSEFCHERGIKLVIDGIQAVGVLATPLTELGADVIVAGGHKGQFSLAGAGFMYATDEMIRMTTPPYAAKFSFTSNDRMQENLVLALDAHRFEYGNPNFLGVWIQRQSAEYLKTIGLQKIEGRIKELTTYLIDRADDMHLKIRTPRPWSARASIVSFDVGDGAAEIVARLRDQNIIVSEKDGHLRAGLQFYNTKDELDRFLEAIQAEIHSQT
ncbi:MAG: aminotransferase class V-fold PLP-dependent enzyme, partial [bacterium]